MLNRRHLRIKVFQAIYSYLRGAKSDLAVGERELLSSVNRIHELFVLHASVFTELHSFAYKRVQERKNKRLPSQEDLNPNLRFVDNELLKAFNKNSIVIIEPKTGDSFDYNLHHAISFQETDEYADGNVIAVMQVGYRIGGRLLRPCMVTVAKKKKT